MSVSEKVPHSMDSKKLHFSPLVGEKLRVWYRMINVRKDGRMCKDDYEEIAERFVQQHKLDSKRKKVVFDWLVNGWDLVLTEHEDKCGSTEGLELVRAMGEGIKAGMSSTEDAYVKALEQLIERNKQLAIDSMERMVSVFFDVFDENQDGYISREEMVVGLYCFGFSDKDLVGKVFDALDTNQDGKLSREEYIYGWVDFFYGDDRENPLTVHFAPHLLK